ncbi:MAG: LysM peptidoglycan-binding domain-containing protein [Clostridia bacterium]
MSFCPNAKRCAPSSLPYIIREGDTLYKIALSYSTTVEDILSANVNLNPYNLNIGQTICVPLPKEQYPSCRTTNYYIAQEGDTFFTISKKFGVDVNELIGANLGVLPENIFTGIILCVPIAPSPVCISIKSDGSMITITEDETGEAKTYKSKINSETVLMPQEYVLTKKRLEAGSLEGAKELLFSPFEIGIRGESKMQDSSAIFVETDDKSMLEIFNKCPVGTILEVID